MHMSKTTLNNKQQSGKLLFQDWAKLLFSKETVGLHWWPSKTSQTVAIYQFEVDRGKLTAVGSFLS